MKNTVQKVFFYLHLIGGMLLAVFGFFHGIGHFSAAPFQMQLTGGVMLLLLIVELFLGSHIYKNETSHLKKVHMWTAIIILCLVVLHLILLRLF